MQIPISVPPALKTIIADIPHGYFTGGCVRDTLLGLTPKDYDIEVHGIEPDDLRATLEKHGKVDLVGKSFAAYKVFLGDEEGYDFTLPRRDEKGGPKHNDFIVVPDPHMGAKEAARRRDFTCNALMVDIHSFELIDPFNGLEALKAGILDIVDKSTFVDDSLRPLRCMRFASRFGFQVSEQTIDLCQTIVDKQKHLPPSRLWGEWEKWATNSSLPSAGLQFLDQSNWLKNYPELHALKGIPQDPIHHPEGDAWTHTLFCTDALANDPTWQKADPETKAITMLGVLCHDLGKATTTASSIKTRRIQAIMHESEGLAPTESFLKNIGTPLPLIPKIKQFVLEHMAYLQVTPTQKEPDKSTLAIARRLADRLSKGHVTTEQLFLVIKADHCGRPPLPKELPERAKVLADSAKKAEVWKTHLTPLISGNDLIKTGLTQGKLLGAVHAHIFDSQLAGNFSTKEEGLEFYRRNRTQILRSLNALPPPLLPFKEIEKLGITDKKTQRSIFRGAQELQLDGKISTSEEALAWAKNQPTQETEPTLP